MVVKLNLYQYTRPETAVGSQIGMVDIFIEGGTEFSKRFYFRDRDAQGQLTIPRDISEAVWTSKIYSPNSVFETEFGLSTEDNSDGLGIIDTVVITLTQAQTMDCARFDRLNFDIDADTQTAIKGVIHPMAGWYDKEGVVVV